KIQNVAELRALLRRLWFDFYPRSGNSTVLDTSGFEHVMVGEYKSVEKASGLHNWLAFYEKEKKTEEPNINYYGYTCGIEPHRMCAAYDWNGRKKRLSSFFLNVSPAFDLAIYTLCFVMRPGTCHVVVDGQKMDLQTFSKDGHVATAFVHV
ncbi:poly(U)-specific endoribonuclease-like, partial [Elysia marginata]